MQSHSTRSQTMQPIHLHQKEISNHNHHNFLDKMTEYFADNVLCACRDPTSVIDEETSIMPSREGDAIQWNIKKEDLQTIPPFYPLDRTFKVIKNTTADIISKRLLKCMKVQNLAIKWTSNKPTLLHCSTNDFLKFEINLWKQDDTSSDEEITRNDDVYNVIVEIRRYAGDCVGFHRLISELFDNICENNYNGGREENNITTTNNVIPNLRPLALDNLMDVLNSVATAYELMFNQNSIDTLMGLQMMIFLTDSSSIHRVYAAHVSDFILLGYDVFDNEVPAVRDVIYNYVANERGSIEHQYALQILTNAFQNSSIQQEIPTNNMPKIDSWNTVIPALILDMDEVEKSPHVAYNAVKCLRTWYCFAGAQADMSYKEQILSSLERVRSYGEQSYISLEREAANLNLVLV